MTDSAASYYTSSMPLSRQRYFTYTGTETQPTNFLRAIFTVIITRCRCRAFNRLRYNISIAHFFAVVIFSTIDFFCYRKHLHRFARRRRRRRWFYDYGAFFFRLPLSFVRQSRCVLKNHNRIIRRGKAAAAVYFFVVFFTTDRPKKPTHKTSPRTRHIGVREKINK